MSKIHGTYWSKLLSPEANSAVSMPRSLSSARTEPSSWTSNTRGRSQLSKSRILVDILHCFSTSVWPCRKTCTSVSFATRNTRSLSNSYRPLPAFVTKTLSFFNFKVNGGFKCRGLGTTNYRTPPDVKNHTFLVRPLVDNERKDLGRGPWRGPIETEPREIKRGFGGMKEYSE
jgi:hypothetical protein